MACEGIGWPDSLLWNFMVPSLLEDDFPFISCTRIDSLVVIRLKYTEFHEQDVISINYWLLRAALSASSCARAPEAHFFSSAALMSAAYEEGE